jgi:hypothetical protein
MVGAAVEEQEKEARKKKQEERSQNVVIPSVARNLALKNKLYE